MTGELPKYRAPSARRDVLAGMTVAALAIPSAMAYGEVAGLSPVNGLYAVLVPMVAYMFLGSSRQLVIGPDGSVSTLVGAAVLGWRSRAAAGATELAGMLALLVGAIFALAWTLRLGWIADYFSRPVLIGYIHGVAVILVCGQLGKLLGLSIDAREPLPQLWEIAQDLGDVSGTTVVVSVVSLVSLYVLRRFTPRAALGADRRRRVDRDLVVARPRGPRRRGRRLDPVGPARPRPCRRRRSATSCSSCPPRSGSSSSRSPTRSSPRGRSPGSTTRTCAPRRSCSRWAPRTPRPGSRRASRSARAARARR